MANAAVLVDADGLLYIAGFGVEKTHYQVILENEQGELDNVWFPSAAEIKTFLAENPDLSEVERIKHKEVGPLEHALMIAKSKMNDIKDRFGPSLEVYIRGDNQSNFRDEIATLYPYKGNRANEKPTYFQEIREYLVDNWGAYKVEDQEVDDELGCRLTELEDTRREAIIVSPDKDLDQLPGRHYSYKMNLAYDVEPIEAQQFFWKQALTGDYSDNIRGCWKCGDKKAEDIISAIAHLDDEEIWQAIVNVYEESMGINGCPYAGMPPEQVALENAQLVYMRRQRGEIWMPPGVPNIQEERKVSLDG